MSVPNRRLVPKAAVLSAWLILQIAANSVPSLQAQLRPQPASAPKPLTLDQVIAERDRAAAQPRNFAWSPGGKVLTYLRTVSPATPAAKPWRATPAVAPPVEIWGVDSRSGLDKSLVSVAELASACKAQKTPATPVDRAGKGPTDHPFLSYFWSTDGKALLLASDVSLCWFDLDAHIGKSLVNGDEELSDPQISPDGRFVSFIRNHAIWLADASSGAVSAFATGGSQDLREGEPDWVYRQELNLRSAYWWSPDSSSIAWLETDDRAVEHYELHDTEGNQRSIAYPLAQTAIPIMRLFVRKVAGGSLSAVEREVDLGKDANVYIPSVQWSPDSKHLAVERLSRNQKILDLLLADPVGGSAKTILTEKDAYWINLDDNLRFLKSSGGFVWSSERSGFRHLYLYDLSGNQVAQLTKGDWAVTSIVMADEAAGLVYFTSTEASPLERQLHRVKLDGTGMTRITQKKGTHAPLFSPAGNAFLDVWSDHAMPEQFGLFRSSGDKIGAKIGDVGEVPKPAPPAVAGISFEFQTVKTHMGMELNSWMMKPPDFDPARKYPVILYVAGGPGEQIVREAWGGDRFLWFSSMAQQGYVVIALDNRGTGGRGHLFEEPIHLRFSAAEMGDVRDLVMSLRAKPWVDGARMGICGWGYGGFLAVHGMLDRPVLFKAGFAGSPVTDWHLYDAVFTERYLEDPKLNQDGWLASAALDNARYFSGSLLVAQATMDESVHLENTMTLLDELLDRGKYPETLIFPDRRDLFSDPKARAVMFQRLTDFFLKNL